MHSNHNFLFAYGALMACITQDFLKLLLTPALSLAEVASAPLVADSICEVKLTVEPPDRAATVDPRTMTPATTFES